MQSSLVFFFSLLFLILPLGLDTLGISLSLGMKSAARGGTVQTGVSKGLPPWLRTAILFSLAEMLMPIVGLLIGAALSTLVSGVMHYLGALLLVGIGAWECIAEGWEYLQKRRKRARSSAVPAAPTQTPTEAAAPSIPATPQRWRWGSQLLLALSVSLDELAVGFSFGSVRNITVNPLTLCIFIGLQGFLMAILGLALGRTLRFRLKFLQEWSELLSAVLLIGLGIWFLFS